ncbi:ERF family protein [Lacticaseibacillus songhuajiangensis]|uniref:ERF family protein n=1 Tax=Lacticaseibacillus songhuajiangensis TaxID=1296539 RepID=UPI001CDCA3F7|nr:ERF family protein [Lacticaseibacillus songhuajiangensis]
MADTTVSTKKPVTKKPVATKDDLKDIKEKKAVLMPDDTSEPLNDTTPKQRLLLKLIAASRSIKSVDKDGENKFQKYHFQSEGAIKAAVKPALEANGIQIIPSYVITDQRQAGKNWIVDVMGSFVITDGIEHITCTMPASGADTLEKATVKACTTAQKYLYKQLFNISDNDTDPDAGNGGDGYQPRGQQQYNQQPQYDQLQSQMPPQPQVPYALINAFQASLADAAAKHGVDLHAAGNAVFAAANVPVQAYTKLTQEQFNSLDMALMQYTKQA